MNRNKGGGPNLEGKGIIAITRSQPPDQNHPVSSRLLLLVRSIHYSYLTIIPAPTVSECLVSPGRQPVDRTHL